MFDPKSTSGGDKFQNEWWLEDMGFTRFILDTLIGDSDTAVDWMCLLIEKWFELGKEESKRAAKKRVVAARRRVPAKRVARPINPRKDDAGKSKGKTKVHAVPHAHDEVGHAYDADCETEPHEPDETEPSKEVARRDEEDDDGDDDSSNDSAPESRRATRVTRSKTKALRTRVEKSKAKSKKKAKPKPTPAKIVKAKGKAAKTAAASDAIAAAADAVIEQAERKKAVEKTSRKQEGLKKVGKPKRKPEERHRDSF
ncbi:MAG: hypothetical protein M1815_004916 [Lichina confinis]|nr:MAG: hypothetical protein M1815_004916 [Lichina confinis]